MTLDPAIFRALVAQGATPEMLLAVVEADAAVREERLNKQREATAARVRKHRAKGQSAQPVQPESNDGNALQAVTPRYDDQSPPNDIYSNPPEKPVEANASTPPFEKLVEEWNAGPAANGARKATKLDANRKALLKARLRDHTEAEVFGAMANLAASKFHCGENDRGWRAGLGWFLEAKNFVKAMEMGEPERKSTAPVVDQAAYLASLESKPFMRPAVGIPQAAARKGNTGPPRPIGDLVQFAGMNR